MSIMGTPERQAPLSEELQKVIAERNVLSCRSREKVLCALNEIYGPETRRQSLLSKATHEILSSELSYVKHLETIMKFFMEPISKQKLMSDENFSCIFGHIETVYRVAGALVTELQTCHDNNLAPAFVRLAPFLKMYSLYACGYNKAITTLQVLRTGRSGHALNSLLHKQECRPEVACSLQSLLITPVQRLPRYRLLLKEVSAHTTHDHPTQQAINEALRGIEASASHVDSLLSEQEQQNRLVQLQLSLTHGWPQILSPGRTLVAEGNFMKVSKCGTRATEVRLILLTDMFLCCRTKFSQLHCKYAFPLIRCSLEKVLGQAVFKILCGTETLLVFARNQEEGASWSSAMSSAIQQLKSSRQTLRKQSSRKRIPKRIEDLEEVVATQLRKRKLSPLITKKKKRTKESDETRDSLYPLRHSSRKQERKETSSSEVDTSSGLQLVQAAENSLPAAPVSWSTHCVDLVRHVAQCIKTAFLRL